MFPSLLSLHHAVQDIRAFILKEKQKELLLLLKEKEISKLITTKFTITPTTTSSHLLSQLINSIEEAFTPNPLQNIINNNNNNINNNNSNNLFETIIVPILHQVPRKHNLHFPLEETLRERQLIIINNNNNNIAGDIFKCWIIYSLNTIDALEEVVKFIFIVDPFVLKEENNNNNKESLKEINSEDLLFQKEKVRRIKQYLGSNTFLLNSEYIKMFISLLKQIYHPIITDNNNNNNNNTEEIIIQYQLSLVEVLPLFRTKPREIYLDQIRIHNKRRTIKKKKNNNNNNNITESNSSNKDNNNNNSMGFRNNDYCYVTDTSTQTDINMNNNNDFHNNNNNNNNKLLNNKSIGINTTNPSTFMTFVELLNAQEEVESEKVKLKHKNENLILKEREITELREEYKEKLDILTYVLHGTKKLYNELIIQQPTIIKEENNNNNNNINEELINSSNVESLLLNLVEVIYGKKSLEELKNKTIPNNSQMRVLGIQTITNHEENRRQRILQERKNIIINNNNNNIISTSNINNNNNNNIIIPGGPLLFPPVKLPRPLQLQQQNYSCPNCNISLLNNSTNTFFRNINININKPRRCHYCTQIYCHNCHRNQLAILPFLVLLLWDFTPKYICIRDYNWLQLNYNKPWCTMGDREGKLEKQYLHPIVMRESIQFTKILRHWFLICAEMIRTCSELHSNNNNNNNNILHSNNNDNILNSKYILNILQTYYANTDVMYSLCDLQGIKYSEESGILARVLHGNRNNNNINHNNNIIISKNYNYNNSLSVVNSSVFMATMGSVVSVMPGHAALGRLWNVLNLNKNKNNNKYNNNNNNNNKYNKVTGISSDEQKDISLQSSVASDYLNNTNNNNINKITEENTNPDFIQFLITSIQAMESHLLYNCVLCMYRATSVCELCGAREANARLPLIDTKIIGIQLLETLYLLNNNNNNNNEETGDKEEKQMELIRLAHIAMQLVRGNNNNNNSNNINNNNSNNINNNNNNNNIEACRRCGTRYHRECLAAAHCPHCT